VLKAPFVALYLARTKDFQALASWVPRELLSLGLPYGGFIEILRSYEKEALRHYTSAGKA
jgi:hypothetical protein